VDVHSVWGSTNGENSLPRPKFSEIVDDVVVYDSTNEIVQVGDLNKPNWRLVWTI
jgi:hypothetical protein